MRIFDQIRGHFALLVNHEFRTLSEEARFIITRVKAKTPRQSDWAVVIRPLKGKHEHLIYIVDILRVYAFICATHRRMSLKELLEERLKNSGISLFKSSYILALLETFDDVEIIRGKDAAIRHISHGMKYGKPVKW